MKVNNSILLALIFILFPINEVISINDPCELVSDGTFIGDRDSCDGWIRCSNGTSHHGKCPEDYRFNVEKEACDLAENIKCKDDDCKHNDENFLPDDRKPKKCSAYFYCHEGVAESYDCPDGLHYDPEQGICNYATSIKPVCVDDNIKDYICANIPVGKKLRDPTDCKKYNECNGKKAESKSCDAGKLFDQRIGDCNDPDKVDCEVQCDETDKKLLNPKSCLSYYECKAGKRTEIKCNKFEFAKETQIEENGEMKKVIKCVPKMDVEKDLCPNRCEGMKSGFIPLYEADDAKKCKAYYTCAEGKILNEKQPHSCPDNYLLNYEEQKCISEGEVDKNTCRKKSA